MLARDEKRTTGTTTPCHGNRVTFPHDHVLSGSESDQSSPFRCLSMHEGKYSPTSLFPPPTRVLSLFFRYQVYGAFSSFFSAPVHHVFAGVTSILPCGFACGLFFFFRTEVVGLFCIRPSPCPSGRRRPVRRHRPSWLSLVELRERRACCSRGHVFDA